MRRCSPSSGRLALVATIATFAWAAPAARAQTDTLSTDLLDDLDRQIEAVKDSSEDLWQEYQKYRPETDEDVQTTGERVEIGNDTTIAAGETVSGDAVAIGGTVHVYGKVEGDAVAVGGSVVLHEGAEVDGDAVAIGGRVRTNGDAKVHGQKVSVNIPLPFGWMHVDRDGDDITLRPSRGVQFVVRLLLLGLGLFLTWLLHLLMERRLDATSRRVEGEPGQSFLVGILGLLGLPIAFVLVSILLAITVVGIVAIPFVFLFGIGLGWAGFAASCLAVGRRVTSMRAGEGLATPGGSSRQLVLGFVTISAFGILTLVLNLVGPAMGPVTLFTGIVHKFVVLFASTLGFGALLLSRLGTQLPGGAPAYVPNRPWETATPPTLPPPPPPAPPAPPSGPAE
ncbi:MAG: hypothetical protein R3B81_14005 [bacterium]